MSKKATVRLDSDRVSFREAVSIAERLAEENSPFEVEKSKNTNRGTVSLNSSMNSVHMMKFGQEVKATISGQDTFVDALSQGLESAERQGEADRRGIRGMNFNVVKLNNGRTFIMNDLAMDGIEDSIERVIAEGVNKQTAESSFRQNTGREPSEADVIESEFAEPIELGGEVTVDSNRNEGVSPQAEIDVMDDGRIEVKIGADTDQYDTLMGVFIDKNANVAEAYSIDNIEQIAGEMEAKKAVDSFAEYVSDVTGIDKSRLM